MTMRGSQTFSVLLAVAVMSWSELAAAQVVITGTATVSTEGSGSTTGAATVDATGSAVAPPPAYTAPPPAESYVAPPPTRVFGLGTAIGGGGAAAGAYALSSSSGVYLGPAIELPTLEALIFIDDHLSVDVSIPLWNSIIISGFSNGLFLWGTNVLLDFSLGDDWVRFIVGPELGFQYFGFSFGSTSYTYTTLGVGALVGVELLTRTRLFGFRAMSRPNIGFTFASGTAEAFAVSGTVLIELGFIWYITNG